MEKQKVVVFLRERKLGVLVQTFEMVFQQYLGRVWGPHRRDPLGPTPSASEALLPQDRRVGLDKIDFRKHSEFLTLARSTDLTYPVGLFPLRVWESVRTLARASQLGPRFRRAQPW
jgi:hypothetical protein